jgi:pyruvate dehydrogenase (quinone)
MSSKGGSGKADATIDVPSSVHSDHGDDDMKKTVAQVLVDVLALHGVTRVHGVAGDSLNGITDAIRRSGKMEWAAVRHEETAAFAAGAEAHLTGKLAVCAGSCGPGNTHLINGLYDCNRSRVPVLAIAAHIPTDEIGGAYFQETHPERIFGDCSVYVEMISHPAQMPRILEIAIQTALARRGVAVVVLPGDIALSDAIHTEPRVFATDVSSTTRPADADLAKAAAILDAASKVTILAGAGCAGARDELLEIAGRLKAPIVHTVRSKEFIEYDNPYDCGLTGLIGFSSGYHAMMACDALLMLGTDFPYRQFYPDAAKIVQVDVRGEQIGRRVGVHAALVGDVKETLSGLTPLVGEKRDRSHLDTATEHYRRVRSALNDLATGEPGRKPIHPQYVARLVDELAGDDAVFTCDVGTPTVWAVRYLRMNGRRRLLGSFNHGSMASALPQAIGAQLAYPKRQVVALCGDGGVAMLLGDLLTLRQLEIPVKVVVFVNGALAFVELEMKAAGIVNYATELTVPDFSKIAEGAGILGIRVDDPGELREALARAFEFDGPALVEVLTARQELSMPPSITLEQARGFSLWVIRTVMSGRGDELVDLVRTNLWR